jgi:hypothetical protein
MLKPSELRFSFPERMYDPTYTREVAQEHFDKTGEKLIPKYVIGWKDVWIDEIKYIGDFFPSHMDIDHVIANKFSSTLLTMDSGEEFICSLKKDKFYELYDAHMQRMDENFVEAEGEIKELTPEMLTDEVAESLSQILKEYRKHKRKLENQLK